MYTLQVITPSSAKYRLLLAKVILTFLPGLAQHPVPVSISSTSVPPFSLRMTAFFYNEHSEILSNTRAIMVAYVVRIGTSCKPPNSHWCCGGLCFEDGYKEYTVPNLETVPLVH